MAEFRPNNTALRTALWRALHVQLEAPPHALNDTLGLKIAAPPEGWQQRPDMHPLGTRPFRASIVTRARFTEDMVQEQSLQGVQQYVILGAGLDTFAQRNPESSMRIFEIDHPDTQAWKQQRLNDLNLPTARGLVFVPVDFEAGDSWLTRLKAAGFDIHSPAVVSSLGVSMYLSRDAIKETLTLMTQLAPRSKFIMTFMLPIDEVEAQDQAGYQMSIRGAQAAGTPFISFFKPDEMLELARTCGFKNVEHFSISKLAEQYFAGRKDGLRSSTGEEFLVATV